VVIRGAAFLDRRRLAPVETLQAITAGHLPNGGPVAMPRPLWLYSVLSHAATLFALAALFAMAPSAQAAKRTVCTVTVNSADEREVFRKRLPEGDYDFVELVERGRPDWLASACRQGVRCDVLVISGHFDGMTEFYSDRLAMRESLPVAEMERASCSESCPGVFAQLKEVYLFGCNTMNAEPVRSTTAEAERSLVRSGMSMADAARVARALDYQHAESSRDHMRRIFTNVPAIYGFTKLAPLGPTAAALLNKYFDQAPVAEFGSGRSDSKLLAQFAASTMVVASGMTASDPDVQFRRETCQFVDDRIAPAAKLAFVHDLFRRDMAEVRMFLDRIEALFSSLAAKDRQAPAFREALESVARDTAARDRYLRFAEDADLSRTRARMIALAGELGWLTPAEQRAELGRMVSDMISRATIGPSDIELFCSLNYDHRLDGERDRIRPTARQADKVNNAAALACLGSAEARARVLRALTSANDADVELASVYLSHRPMTDVEELRVVATGIARMPGSGAQIRALDTLARHRLSDGQSLNELARLFPAASSVDVQRAIASVLIRADYQAIAKPEFVRTLAQNRRKSPDGTDIIDILIRRLRAPDSSPKEQQ
jgi:hypothetical protein